MNEEQEQQLIRESSRGAKARAWLDSEMTKEAFAVVENDTLAKWKESPIRDVEGQTYLRLKWQVIQEMRKHFEDIAQTGKMAVKQLEHERSLAQRVRDSVKMFRRSA